METGDRERTVHRLEAFSDIVIGFCIAEMGANLLIPRTAAELPSIVVGTNAFGISFVLIAILWWTHHRLFKSLFVLTPLTLILNFAMLGCLVLMVYFQQVSLHLIVSNDRPQIALLLWLVSYALVFTLLAAMMWLGLRVRWQTLSDDDLRWGLNWALMNSSALLFFIIGSAISVYQGNLSAVVIALFLAGLVIRFAVDRVVKHVIARRAAIERASPIKMT